MRAVPVLLILVATALAGCSDSAPAGATARELLATADAEAQAWNPAATLVAVQAVELHEAMEDEGEDDDPFFTAANRADPAVGNGRAAAWAYEYKRSDSDERFQVVVDEDGKAQTSAGGDGDDSPFGGEPIGSWRVDSDQVARTLRREASDFSQRAADEDAIVLWTLGRENATADAVWATVVFSIADGAEDVRIFIVGAVNGTYLGSFSLEDFVLRFSLPPQEWGSFSEQLTTATPAAMHSFNIDHEGHERLNVIVRSADPTVGSTLNITILQGDVLRFAGDLESGLLSESLVKTFFLPANAPLVGTWTVQVALTEGLAQGYEVLWCAPGLTVTIDQPPFSQDTACD